MGQINSKIVQGTVSRYEDWIPILYAGFSRLFEGPDCTALSSAQPVFQRHGGSKQEHGSNPQQVLSRAEHSKRERYST